MTRTLRIERGFGAGVTASVQAVGEQLAYRVYVDGKVASSKSVTLGSVGVGGAEHRAALTGMFDDARTRASGRLKEAGQEPPKDDFLYLGVPDSSKAVMIGYDEGTERLRVIFRGAARYLYSKVPLSAWHALLTEFMAGGSVGSWLAENVEGTYEYERERA
jgi:hypothetical protein